MSNIFIIQTDNRPSLDYLIKTQKINKKFCNLINSYNSIKLHQNTNNYNYLFITMDNNIYKDIHPATQKIHIVDDFLKKQECDILVFLDSDAWINNIINLDIIINKLVLNKQKHGCFSRDPTFAKNNTFINSGSFIIKNNNFIKKMYSDIIKDLYSNKSYHNKWPYDQFYISNYIFTNKEKFIIFIPNILNTPNGKVLRHNWYKKDDKMRKDLDELLIYLDSIKPDCLLEFKQSWLKNNDKEFIIEQFYDDKPFPNTGT